MVANYELSYASGFEGPGQAHEGSGYKYGNRVFFEHFRDEKISRYIMPSYEWGNVNISYTPKPNTTNHSNFRMPPTQISMQNPGRQREIEDFYQACQQHRDQYKDYTNTLHPLDYFKRKEIAYQCPKDITSAYLKYPERYVEYKNPAVLPLTTGLSYRSPNLPDRALTGIYNRSSDISYKR